MTSRTRARVVVGIVMVALGAAGCAAGDTEEADYHGEGTGPDVGLGKSDATLSIGAVVSMTCTTASISALSKQIAAEVHCIAPDALEAFTATDGIAFTGSAVIPYLAHDSVANLKRAALDTGSVQIVSAFRTVAQQYLIYRWYQAGRCGITAAATPGKSNHESGRALDVSNWSSARAALESNGWAHDVPGDAVHFTGSGAPLQGLDVMAFQRLWNRNHSADTIAEDGDYGPATADRLSRSPIGGFHLGADCI